jgi:hypothetical protein
MKLNLWGLALAAWCGLVGITRASENTAAFVRVSPRDPRYFELSDGRPYLPIGLNMIAPDGARGNDEAGGLRRMDEWMQQLSTNGGNFIRVWLSSPFWEVEHERSGVYDEARARRIDALLAMAQRHGLQVKLTLEHFREISENPRQRWANNLRQHVDRGGTATNMADFFSGEASRRQFQKKLAWFAQRYGDNPTVFGWELWNEINATTTGPENFMPWTSMMLAELHRLFPHHLAMQSLGSFDTDRVRLLYRQMSLLAGNDVAQVHRYLDLGASLAVCHGPMDVLAAEAARELLAVDPRKPVMLAESGAVEPQHSGPFKLYAQDKDGIILHDLLFAPFFAGAAGAGQSWHWDVYVDRNNLWHHFARFATVVKELDPPAEHFVPSELPHPRLRVYVLKGQRTILIWCRDRENTWQTELAQQKAPELIEGMKLDLPGLLADDRPQTVRIYDPWKDAWRDAQFENRQINLPQFKRSLVVRFTLVK